MKSTIRTKKNRLLSLIASTIAMVMGWSGGYWSVSKSIGQENRFFDAGRSNLTSGRTGDFNQDATPKRQPGTLERMGSLPSLSEAAEEKTQTPLSPLNSQTPYRLTARIHLEEGTNQGYLVVQVELAKGNYIHSLFMDEALNPSQIEVQSNGIIQVLDQFESDLSPKVIEKDPIFGKRMEKHYQRVQFFAPIRIEMPDQFHENAISVLFSGQVCSDQGMCLPIRSKKIEAGFSSFFRRNSTDQATRVR